LDILRRKNYDHLAAIASIVDSSESPKKIPYDVDWKEEEKTKFKVGMRSVQKKNFYAMQNSIPGKTTRQIVSYYYRNKYAPTRNTCVTVAAVNANHNSSHSANIGSDVNHNTRHNNNAPNNMALNNTNNKNNSNSNNNNNNNNNNVIFASTQAQYQSNNILKPNSYLAKRNASKFKLNTGNNNDNIADNNNNNVFLWYNNERYSK